VIKAVNGLATALRPAALGLVATAMLAACSNPVGNGIGPTSLVVTSPSLVPGGTAARAYRCLPVIMGATLNFSNGGSGNFTARARWTSSNPSVIAVSNGDIAIPGQTNAFYPIGTVIASATNTGTAVITADFSGLSSSITMDTGLPTNFTVKRLDTQTGDLVALPQQGLRQGPATIEDLTITASIDGVEQSVESAANWRFDVANDAVATIAAGTGNVTGIAAGGPLTARASFPACDITVSTPVSILPIQGITIEPEFTSNGLPAQLVVSNAERFRVLANLGNGPEQDVSAFSTLTATPNTVANFSTAIGANNILNALTAGGPVTIGATLVQSSTLTLTAPTIAVTTVADTLQSLAITPNTARITANSAEAQTLSVIGTYTSGRQQSISRIATWSSSDAAIAAVGTGLLSPGRVTSSSRTAGTATITAAGPTSASVTAATAQVTTTVLPPSSP